jgi:hypothetical protein
LREGIRDCFVDRAMHSMRRTVAGPEGRLVIVPAGHHMEVQVPDALAAIWAAGVQDDNSARPKALNHGAADSLHQRDGLGEILSRCVKDTY